MRKIKDRIILGAITGIISAVPIQVCEALIHKYRITDVPYAYLASKIFLTRNKIKTPVSKVVSAIVNSINAGLASTAITYTLSLTGKNYALLKGAGIGSVLWVGISGLLSNIGLNIKTKKPFEPLIVLGEHLVFGTLCSYLITKLGDDSLFPDNSIRKQAKIPVTYSGNIGGNENSSA